MHPELRSPAVRAAAFSPDLERYLDRAHVDLAVTDQVDALKVRVRRGLEVLERGAGAGIDVAVSQRRWSSFAAGVIVGVTVATTQVSGGLNASPFVPMVVVVGVVVAAIFMYRAWNAHLDRARLAVLRTKFCGDQIEELTSVESVLSYAERVLSAARRVGVARLGGE